MKKFDFEEINLLPQLCVVKSRSECDTSITFGGNSVGVTYNGRAGIYTKIGRSVQIQIILK
jgi:hypothetical protein